MESITKMNTIKTCKIKTTKTNQPIKNADYNKRVLTPIKLKRLTAHCIINILI